MGDSSACKYRKVPTSEDMNCAPHPGHIGKYFENVQDHKHLQKTHPSKLARHTNVFVEQPSGSLASGNEEDFNQWEIYSGSSEDEVGNSLFSSMCDHIVKVPSKRLKEQGVKGKMNKQIDLNSFGKESISEDDTHRTEHHSKTSVCSNASEGTHFEQRNPLRFWKNKYSTLLDSESDSDIGSSDSDEHVTNVAAKTKSDTIEELLLVRDLKQEDEYLSDDSVASSWCKEINTFENFELMQGEHFKNTNGLRGNDLDSVTGSESEVEWLDEIEGKGKNGLSTKVEPQSEAPRIQASIKRRKRMEMKKISRQTVENAVQSLMTYVTQHELSKNGDLRPFLSEILRSSRDQLNVQTILGQERAQDGSNTRHLRLSSLSKVFQKTSNENNALSAQHNQENKHNHNASIHISGEQWATILSIWNDNETFDESISWISRIVDNSHNTHLNKEIMEEISPDHSWDKFFTKLCWSSSSSGFSPTSNYETSHKSYISFPSDRESSVFTNFDGIIPSAAFSQTRNDDIPSTSSGVTHDVSVYLPQMPTATTKDSSIENDASQIQNGQVNQFQSLLQNASYQEIKKLAYYLVFNGHTSEYRTPVEREHYGTQFTSHPSKLFPCDLFSEFIKKIINFQYTHSNEDVRNMWRMVKIWLTAIKMPSHRFSSSEDDEFSEFLHQRSHYDMLLRFYLTQLVAHYFNYEIEEFYRREHDYDISDLNWGFLKYLLKLVFKDGLEEIVMTLISVERTQNFCSVLEEMFRDWIDEFKNRICTDSFALCRMRIYFLQKWLYVSNDSLNNGMKNICAKKPARRNDILLRQESPMKRVTRDLINMNIGDENEMEASNKSFFNLLERYLLNTIPMGNWSGPLQKLKTTLYQQTSYEIKLSHLQNCGVKFIFNKFKTFSLKYENFKWFIIY